MSDKFKITYENIDGETRVTIKEFENHAGITAKEWAEDYAYMLADKGQYKVELLRLNSND